MTVNADCTGTTTGTLSEGGVAIGNAQAWFIVLDSGDTVWAIEVQNPVALGTMTRISH